MNSNIILDEYRLKEAVEYFRTQPAFVFDVEAQGEYRGVPHLASLSWLSMATKGACVVIPFGHPIGSKIIGETKVEAVYGSAAKKAGQTYFKKVPVYEPPPPQLSPGTVFSVLEPLFSDPGIIKAGHDVVYDLTSSAKYFGKVASPPYDDTKIDCWLLNENRKRFGLKELVEETYGHKYDYEGVGSCVEKFPFDLVAYYSYCDSKYSWLLYLKYIKMIKEQGLMPIHDMEMNLLNTMVGMRLSGARVDIDRLHSLSDQLGKELIQQEAAIYSAAGRKFNVNSSPQKQIVLYGSPPEGQGLKPWKLTAGGLKKQKLKQPLSISDYSTDDEVLASFPDNPVAYSLREYGDTQKLLSTYVNGYLGDDEKPCLIYDGHIHAGFMQYGTVTGRFACRTPNLQNLPRPHTERGKLIRGIFIAEDGGKLIVADYGQIELVVLAHYVGEGKLYEAFMNGIDPHLMTAAMVLDKEPKLCDCDGPCKLNHVTKVERQDLGKAQPCSSKILTQYGWKNMGDLVLGDWISTPDDSNAQVCGIYPQGIKEIWKILFSDGTSVRCDPEHLWKVNTRHSSKLLTAREILASGLTIKNGNNIRNKYDVPAIAPQSFNNGWHLPGIDPYVLGVLLGDGSFRHPDSLYLSSADSFILDEVKNREPDIKITYASNYDYRLNNSRKLRDVLLQLELWGKDSHHKFIPQQYLFSSLTNRISLLKGLMDTDGYCNTNAFVNEYCSVSKQLANDVAFLVRSLGGTAKVNSKKTSWTHNGVNKSGIAYRVSIWTPFNPFLLPRKADNWIVGKPHRKSIVAVEPDGFEEARCIMVDHPDHLYITDGMTPTHNTLGFAIVYGAGIYKVASMAHLTPEEAKRKLKKHAEMFPEIHDFRDSVIHTARNRQPVPYITTLFGRKRRIPELNSSVEGIRKGAERQLFNSLIQGGAADLIKLSMIRVDSMIPPEVQLIMTVHDEIVLSAPDSLAQETAAMLKEAMTGEKIQRHVKVPLLADVKIVDRWSEAK